MRTAPRGSCLDEADVGIRCMLAFSLWIGDHFIAADHSARDRAEVLELVMRPLLA
jgi:hypothetical protein